MNDYEKLKEFWNYKQDQPEAINEAWITAKKFNQIINDYLKDGDNVLDYGSGSGWGLTELTFKKKITGIGIDTASNSVEYANKVLELSNIKNIKFIQGDEYILDDYQNQFDFILSINTIDVVPDEICENILSQLKKVIKKGGYLFIGLNPDFTIDELVNMLGMVQKDHYFCKNDVLRANKKAKKEWADIFSKYFEVIENFDFEITENDINYPRNGYLLKA